MDRTPTLHVATPAVEEALNAKMASMALKQKEEQVHDHAASIGLPYIDLAGFPIGPDTIGIIPKDTAETLQVVCFLRTSEQLRVGAVDPLNPEIPPLLHALGQKHHAHVELYAISQHSFEAVQPLYDKLPKIRRTTSGVELTQDDIERFKSEIHDLRELDAKVQNISVTDTFSLLLAGALSSNSSDLHIEAEEDGIRARYRIDGVLVTVATLARDRWPRIISRIKLLAGLKLNITSAPQDGHITIFLNNDKVDVRVSTLPTAFGESVVMRILRSTATGISYDDLGLRGRAYDELKKEVERPHGMVIITGPTGSGKTTTLYAVLTQLNQADTKIITLEDPVEYKLAGINQSQVDWSKGYTFAAGLRSILRQDPDIVLVGEIRDTETAETAIQAALTGHLVLSTIHTNDAAGAIPRFLSMSAKPYLLAPALNAAVGQRLVRKICPDCKVADSLDAPTMEKVQATIASIPKNSGYAVDINRPLSFYRGRGCEACHGIGYRGRIGIFEVFVVDDAIEKLIIDNQATEYAMRDAAKNQGMVTMVQDGLLKALDGMTTVEEVFRVAQ